VYSMRQKLFSKSNAVFQDNSDPIHIAGPVQSWFEKHEGEFQHLPWPSKWSDLNIIQPLWPVSETRLRNRFPLQTSVKQHDVLREEWSKILLGSVQYFYQSIPEGLQLYWWQKVAQHHINKEMCTVFVGFPLFCRTSVDQLPVLSQPWKLWNPWVSKRMILSFY
jgi:hypothetical protein